MGSTLSKFFIAAGFVLVFTGLFFRTWKYSSPPHKEAARAMWEHSLKEDSQAPPKLGFPSAEFLSEAEFASYLGMNPDQFNKSELKSKYDERKKEFEKEKVEKLKEMKAKAEKGELDEQEDQFDRVVDWLNSRADCAVRANEIALERQYWGNEVGEERAQKDKLRWHIGFLIYFGVFAIAIGFIMLSVTGEGNEKVGAIIALGMTLLFIVFFFGGV